MPASNPQGYSPIIRLTLEHEDGRTIELSHVGCSRAHMEVCRMRQFPRTDGVQMGELQPKLDFPFSGSICVSVDGQVRKHWREFIGTSDGLGLLSFPVEEIHG